MVTLSEAFRTEPVINIVVTGARGPMGPASGPLGAGSVTAETVSDDPAEHAAITAKIGAVATVYLAANDIAHRGTVNDLVDETGPFNRLQVVFSRFSNQAGNQIRAGNNVYASQATWEGFSAIGNITQEVQPNADPESTATVTAVLSYVNGSLILGNFVDTLVGGKNAETAYFYTKSRHGIVALNYACEGEITAGGSGTFYGVNLKGAARGVTTSPQGYGAMALGNHLAGKGAVSNTAACQMQSDEQAVIANNFDNWKRGLEYSGPISGSIVGLNRAYGALADKAMAGVVSGRAHVNIGNALRRFLSGIEYSVATGENFDMVAIVDQVVEGPGSGAGAITALTLQGVGTGTLTNVLVANAIFRGFTAGANLTSVTGATLSNVDFVDVLNATSGGKRAWQFSSCHDIVARNPQRCKAQTVAGVGSPVPLFEMQISNTNAMHLRVHMVSRKNDGTLVEGVEAWAIAKMEGGVATVVASGSTKKVPTGTVDIVFSIVSGVRVRASAVGTTGETWDHLATYDFEML